MLFLKRSNYPKFIFAIFMLLTVSLLSEISFSETNVGNDNSKKGAKEEAKLAGRIIFTDEGGESGLKGTVEVVEFESIGLRDEFHDKYGGEFDLLPESTIAFHVIKDGVIQGETRSASLKDIRRIIFFKGYGHEKFRIVMKNHKSALVKLAADFVSFNTLKFIYKDPAFGGSIRKSVWINELIVEFD